MQRTTLFVILGCAFCAAAPAALAFQPLLTDDTGTQGAGGNQLEFSYSENQATTDGTPASAGPPPVAATPASTVASKVIPVVYTRGITDTVDVFAQFNEGGSGNPSFGFKWHFLENEGSGTGVAFKSEVRLPLNPKGEPIADVLRTSASATAILSQEVPFGAVHANLFYGQDSFSDRRNTASIPAAMGGRLNLPDTVTTRLSIAPVWDVSEEFKLALDLAHQRATTAGATTVSNIAELGVIYSPSKELDLAAGIIQSIDDANPKTTTVTGTVGVTWRFK